MSCAISSPAYASYDVLIHQLAALLTTSFRRRLAATPLRVASSWHRAQYQPHSVVIFLQRTSTSSVHAHARRTQVARSDANYAALRLRRTASTSGLKRSAKWLQSKKRGRNPFLCFRCTGAEDTVRIEPHRSRITGIIPIWKLQYPRV